MERVEQVNTGTGAVQLGVVNGDVIIFQCAAPCAAHTAMLVKALLVLAVATAAAAPAWAVNKCTGPDGKVAFQDAPCPNASKAEALDVRAPAPSQSPDAAAARARSEIAHINQRAEIQAAINRQEPVIGMTAAELDAAMGAPNRVNAGNYNGELHDQLIYDRGARTWYVYTKNGIVRSIQNSERVGGEPAPKRCITPHEIRNLETSASSITLSEAQRRSLYDQIRDARNCLSR